MLLGLHAATAVGDRDPQPTGTLISQFDKNPSLFGGNIFHRLQSVAEQVDQHLRDLRAIRVSLRCVRVGVDVDRHSGPALIEFRDPSRVADQRSQIQPSSIHLVTPSEADHLADRVVGIIRLFQNHDQRFTEFLAEHFLAAVQIIDESHRQISDVANRMLDAVRDPRRQFTQQTQTSRVKQLCVELSKLRILPSSLGDIHGAGETRGMSIQSDRGQSQVNPSFFSRFGADRDFTPPGRPFTPQATFDVLLCLGLKLRVNQVDQVGSQQLGREVAGQLGHRGICVLRTVVAVDRDKCGDCFRERTKLRLTFTQLLLGSPPRRHVSSDHQVSRVAKKLDHRIRHGHVDDRPVRSAIFRFELAGLRAVNRRDRTSHRQHGDHQFEVTTAHPQQLLTRITQKFREAIIAFPHRFLGAGHHENSVRRVLEQNAISHLGSADHRRWALRTLLLFGPRRHFANRINQPRPPVLSETFLAHRGWACEFFETNAAHKASLHQCHREIDQP